jgi:Sulfate permease family
VSELTNPSFVHRHGAALKKNVPNLSRKVRSDDPILEKNQKRIESEDSKAAVGIHILSKPPSVKSRKFSEAVDIEAVMQLSPSKSYINNGTAETMDDNNKPQFEIYQAKPTSATLKMISLCYGKSQIVTSIVGGFAITPSVAASSTMFSLGAESLAPQIGSVVLLFVFYLTDFQIVGYIPKPAFSSMLVLAFIDMINTWFYKSYFKTKDKMEWMVVPVSFDDDIDSSTPFHV